MNGRSVGNTPAAERVAALCERYTTKGKPDARLSDL
jgi:hypothetical protein